MFGHFYGHFSDINCSRFYPGVPITLFVKMASLFMNDFYHDLDESVQSCRLIHERAIVQKTTRQPPARSSSRSFVVSSRVTKA